MAQKTHTYVCPALHPRRKRSGRQEQSREEKRRRFTERGAAKTRPRLDARSVKYTLVALITGDSTMYWSKITVISRLTLTDTKDFTNEDGYNLFVNPGPFRDLTGPSCLRRQQPLPKPLDLRRRYGMAPHALHPKTLPIHRCTTALKLLK